MALCAWQEVECKNTHIFTLFFVCRIAAYIFLENLVTYCFFFFLAAFRRDGPKIRKWGTFFFSVIDEPCYHSR